MRITAFWVAALFTCVMSEAATFNGFAGFGSASNAIAQYSVPGSRILSVGVYQNTSSSPIDVGRPTNIMLKKLGVNTLDDMNILMRQTASNIAQCALTNSLVDKDQPFHIFANTLGGTDNLDLYYLFCDVEFSLEKRSDGSYRVPSFNGFCLKPSEGMTYEISGLEWARLDVMLNDDTGAVLYSEDSRYDVANYINIDLKYISLQNAWATSGPRGEYLVKITTVTRSGTNYSFKVYGPEGIQIPETPVRTSNMVVTSEGVSFDIDGGDTGRILIVQRAASLNGPWTDVGEELVVPPGKYPPMYFRSEPQPGRLGFYRVRAVNKVSLRSPF